MNFSVHLSMVFPDSSLMAGQYIADFLQKKEADLIHNSLKKGILMHRWLDHYSNNHDALSRMNSHLHSSVGKYAPVASDIICDHLLFLLWRNYFDIEYEDYVYKAYDLLNEHALFFPERCTETFYRMRDGNWLMQYASVHGLEYVFNRMNTKAKFKVDFNQALYILSTHQNYFLELFSQFYSDALRESKTWSQQYDFQQNYFTNE